MDGKAFLLLAVLTMACRTAPPALQTPQTPQFVYCPPAKFANCTVAKCETKKDGSGYSCNCFLDDRFSATAYASQCVASTATTAQSRYHPVRSYQECTNSSTDMPLWAWCLGVSCTIDSNGTGVACDCTVPPKGVQPIPYIVVTSTYLPNGCEGAGPGEVWSSATPGDVSQITEFLEAQPGLQSLPLPVVVRPTP